MKRSEDSCKALLDGGTEYLSISTFDNCTVEEMCDFFNCDDTRASWDRLLFRHRVLERDERTGAEVVFWVGLN